MTRFRWTAVGLAAAAALAFGNSTYAQPCGPAAPVTYTITPTAAGFTSILPPGPGTPVGYISPPVGCTNWCPGTVDDDGTPAIPIGFDFVYFGSVKTEFRVNANGFIWFDFGPLACGYFGNAPVPTGAAPNDAIFPFWDDQSHSLVAPGPPAAVTALVGTPGSRERIVEFSGLTPFTGSCAFPGTQFFYQVALKEKTNEFELRYNPQIGVGGTISATVGFENATGTFGYDVTGLGAGNPALPTSNYLAIPCDPCGLAWRYGVGCPVSSGNVPAIGTSGGAPTSPNPAFAVTLSNAAPSTGGLLVMGVSRTASALGPLPLGLGFLGLPCTLFVSFNILFSAPVSGAGTASVGLPIPGGLTCSGPVYFQWVVIDPALGPPLPIRLSDALHVSL